MSFFRPFKSQLPDASTALSGRENAVPVFGTHVVLNSPTVGPWPEGHQIAVFGMGCFWGIERLFWRIPGVYSTAAGYAGGFTRNPSYQEVCSGRTGHTEVVLVVFDPAKVTYGALLKAFWENHDPTQGMRQHNDAGTQYRSAIYAVNQDQLDEATASRQAYQSKLKQRKYGEITTEITAAGPFFYAEDHHQQYLDKNPGGYCNMHGTGIACSIEAARTGGVAGLGIAP